ncbi:ATP synthase complex assembly protein atp12 [Orbilia brochopaga]|uniref:ATP synthase complex assembly protein atp12 n=1 Tax=Orbilia brochopaga TaxID=3140254 RepID=A0AAV9V782_9PEZI
MIPRRAAAAALAQAKATRSASVCWRCSTLSTIRPLAIAPQSTSRRSLHTTPAYSATPLPLGGTAAGPPPDPPQPQTDYVTRQRLRQAAFPKPRTERFWQDVHLKLVDDRYQILLDARPLKTPAKHTLSVPQTKPLLAYALQLEWVLMRTSKEALKPHFIPLTSLASRAIDLEEAEKTGKTDKVEVEAAEGDEKPKGTREQIVDFVMGYLDTDTVLMISPTRGGHLAAPGEKQLRDLQLEAANDMINWAKTTIPVPEGEAGLDFLLSDGDYGLLPNSQSDRTKDVLRRIISDFSAWELVGLERAVILSKSLLVGLRLVMENKKYHSIRWDVEEAAKACNLETDFQVEQWGLVEDTHDVNHVDLRRGLGSVVLLVSGMDLPIPPPPSSLQ